MRDLVIIGGGPAALTAALYAAREGLDVVTYEKEVVGGLTSSISELENFPGYPNGVTGMELTERMREQAEKFGAEIEYGEVTKIERDGKDLQLMVDGEKVAAKAVLIATGCKRANLGVPGETLAGVHYCATCDGAFYKDKNIIVVGGSNSAVQEAMFLAKFARHITIVTLFDIMASKTLQKKLDGYIKSGQIEVHTYMNTAEIVGEGKVQGLKALDKDGKERIFEVDGIFVFIGIKPNTDFLRDSKIELDERDHVKTNAEFETSLRGVFAAGDVRSGALKQTIIACGEGASAAMNIGKYLEKCE